MRRLLALALLAAAAAASPADAPLFASAAKTRPRLAVVIVVDQLRADYLERFAGEFRGGFKRLLEEGRVFTSANYEQWPTVTATGHATIATGATPAGHGIVGNGWFDRETGSDVVAVADPSSPTVPTGKPGASPWRLDGATIGDELKLATRGVGKVVSISLKDRSAVLLGGKLADAALWFDAGTGSFVTSRYYGAALPAWAQKLNATRPADGYLSATWDLLLPESAYAISGPDDRPDETPGWGGKTLPKALGAGLTAPGGQLYGRVEESPFGNEIVAAAAKAAVDGEGLGADDIPDLLAVSFSSNDIVGHHYGPYSREVQDITLRTDLVIGRLLDFLDERVGRDRYVVVLSSDHGAAPTPADSARLGGRYARIEASEPAVLAALERRFGAGKWILDVSTQTGVWLNQRLARERGVDPVALERAAAAEFAGVPGVRAAYTATDLASGSVPPGDVVGRRVAAGFFPGRSPDVVVILEPFIVGMSPGGTTHGTPYNYDTHVPMIFCGPGIGRASVADPVAVVDLAPTLAAVLGITPPANASGHALPLR